MKNKFLVFTLSLTLLFSSLNYKRIHANPIIGKVAEVSIIYAIGRLAYDTVGIVGTISDIIDIGGTIYNKMTLTEKEEYKNSIKFENDKFTYSDNSYSYISSYVPSSKGNHMMPGIKKHIFPEYYDTDKTVTVDALKKVFEANKQVINYQGINYDFLFNRRPYGNTTNYYNVLYKKSDESNIQYVTYLSDKDVDLCFSLYFTDDFSLRLDRLQKNNNGEYEYRSYAYLYEKMNVNKCVNCPHDISLKDSYDYPSKEELDFIEQNYPQYENDIPSLNVPDQEGGSNGGGSNGGGSNGGGNNTIISNPPSFPDLQEFDFSGLNLEPLTNLFSNLKTKFPFSLPFDLSNLIDSLCADPIPPRFETEIFNCNLVLDFTEFEILAQIIRSFVLLSYVVSLIFITKRFGG